MSTPCTDELNRLHAEIDHLTTTHHTAAGLARALAEHLSGEPLHLADQLARLLDGELEPDDIPEGET
ncbi:hypothetical protein [Streptomyces sp. NPDC001833]|uniref:hypothetical protein n=1 Tax=Streptomyces sp. NPDC001833 TaxID=3154658 RepID=UPI00331E78F0